MSTSTQSLDPQDLEKKSTSLTVQAEQVQSITTTQQYTLAINLGRSLKAMEDGIDEFWGPLVANAHRQHKELVKRRDDMKSPVQVAIARLKGMIAAYDQEQEKIRRQKEMEAQAALRKAEEDRAIAEAEALQAAGDAEGANAVISQAAASPATVVVMPSTVPKVAGKSSRQVWKWRIKNPSEIKRDYLVPDEPAISAMVRALRKKAEGTVGGIEVYSEESISLR